MLMCGISCSSISTSSGSSVTSSVVISLPSTIVTFRMILRVRLITRLDLFFDRLTADIPYLTLRHHACVTWFGFVLFHIDTFDGRACCNFAAVNLPCRSLDGTIWFCPGHVCVMSCTSMFLDKFISVFSTIDRVSISLGSVVNIFFVCLLAKLYVEMRFYFQLQFRISSKASQCLLLVQIVFQLLTHRLLYLSMM
ncbi:hypothetical protein ALC62_06756 [Cyphomyrmex costatus]|uniref:Uncharacterized protein n=1 Tax=Cyphomyrmex costatus TaxID=456900 RepID=A0A195CNT3_9HYME|nr:hypothetical protein ALC62_06756 [Cyphomyrmex costatus]